ncbi:ATP synthase subunit b [Commensalibacter sp. Nvir]|uniref:F0F1 ATP synthase subunit B n=1 Tax=Commensalibacter sp. Nvir TaxID=3069817 RepID=UPI002D365295|nr:ATP synthase subunit b [Commensalibacter sp. Nvir]
MHLVHEPHFWSAIAFVLFFIVFGKKIWRPFAAMLDDRTQKVKAELEEASRLKREAEDIYTKAQKEYEATKKQAERMLEESKQAASLIASNAKKEAEASAKRQEELAHIRLKVYEQDAINAVRRKAADIAVCAARDVISSVLTEEKNTNLVDKAIDKLPKTLSDKQHVA